MSMIRLQEMTPDVYYRQSRDFQFIGRLFDVVLNSVKTNADLISALPLSKNSDEKLIDLLTFTLGFKPRHHYNINQLTALCSVFCDILRHKGSIMAITTAANALIHAEGIKQDALCYFDYKKDEGGNPTDEFDYTTLNVFLAEQLSDINLFKDLLDYILPAGISCNIVRSLTSQLNEANTELGFDQGTITVYDQNGDAVDTRITPAGTNMTELGKMHRFDGTSETTVNAHAGSTSGLLAHSFIYRGTVPVPDETVSDD